MTTEPMAAPARAAKPTNGFRFQATDVTNTHVIDATDVARDTPTSAVAQALAARMELPPDTSWALRDDRTGNYLDDQRAIGEQIESEARLTLTPKAHLG